MLLFVPDWPVEVEIPLDPLDDVPDELLLLLLLELLLLLALELVPDEVEVVVEPLRDATPWLVSPQK